MRTLGQLFMLTIVVVAVFITEEIVEGTCPIIEVPLDSHFDETLMLGQWIEYNHFGRDHLNYDMVLDIHRDDDGELYYDEYIRDDPDAPCAFMQKEGINSTGITGKYILEDSHAVVKMMHLTHNVMSVLLCLEHEGDNCLWPTLESYVRWDSKLRGDEVDAILHPLLPFSCANKTISGYNVIREACLVNEESTESEDDDDDDDDD